MTRTARGIVGRTQTVAGSRTTKTAPKARRLVGRGAPTADDPQALCPVCGLMVRRFVLSDDRIVLHQHRVGTSFIDSWVCPNGAVPPYEP